MLDHASSRYRVLAFAIAALLVGCMDAPNLEPLDATGAPSANGPRSSTTATGSEHDGMVLVPSVTLAAPGSVMPSDGKGQGDNGKGKDKGKDAGPPSPPGTPTGTPTPPPSVDVASFWLDAREVTVANYRACVGAGACTAPDGAPGCTLAEGLEDHPINCVTSDQARAFCTWMQKRLVRNDEWTAAAAGSTGRLYPWGTEPPAADRLDACGPECAPSGMYGASDGYVRTAPGGSFPLGQTPDGAFDLAGNVAEWVDGTLTSIARGGSFADVDARAVASTSEQTVAAPGPSIGFRCALDQ